jgi:hypothetical protein
MKKVISIFAFTLMCVASVTALNMTLRDTYTPAETVVVEITGSILSPIKPSDVVIKRGTVPIAPIFEVKRVGVKQYVYFIAPLIENNYTLNINNVATTVNGVPTTLSISRPFAVAGAIAPYTVRPGIIIGKKMISLTITGNTDENQEITFGEPLSQTRTINPGQNVLTFDPSEYTK